MADVNWNRMKSARIQLLSESTQASLQASLVAVTLEDICGILIRHVYAGLREDPPDHKLIIAVTMDYETWSLTVKHNAADCTSVDASSLDLLSYIGLLHCRTCTNREDTTRAVQDGIVLASGPTKRTGPHDEPYSPMHMLQEGRGGIVCLRNIFGSLPVRRSFLSSETQRRKQNEQLMDLIRQLALLRPAAAYRFLVLPQGIRYNPAAPKTLLSIAPVSNIAQRFEQMYASERTGPRTMHTFASNVFIRGSGAEKDLPPKYFLVRLQGTASLHPEQTAVQIVLINRHNCRHLQTSRSSQSYVFDKDSMAAVDDLAGGAGGNGNLQDLYTCIDARIASMQGAATAPKGMNHAFAIVLTVEAIAEHMLPPGIACQVSLKAAILNSIYERAVTEAANLTSDRLNDRRTASVSSVQYIGCKRPQSAPSASTQIARSSARRPQTASLEGPQHAPRYHIAPSGMTSWQDPTTKELFFIDNRTGQSFSTTDRGAEHDAIGSQTKSDKSTGVVHRHKLRKIHSAGADQRAPNWLSATLEDWKNPAFGNVSSSMLAAPKSTDEFDDPDLEEAMASLPLTPRKENTRKNNRPHTISRFFGTSVRQRSSGLCGLTSDHTEATEIEALSELPIRRDDLASAQVLNQVDGKYILCTMTCAESDSPVLVCFDQHAVDERCRLEQFLQDYVASCYDSVPVLSHTVTFTVAINRKEYDLLSDKDASSAAAWMQLNMSFLGFAVVRVVLIHEGLGHAQVDLAAIPQVLHDRVVSLSGRVHNQELLTTTFRAILTEVLAHPIPSSVLNLEGFNSTSPSAWLDAARHFPPSLMNLFFSKACRSAIMFNDPLSKSACQTLIERLAHCQFPFQCAHGRPTLAPLCRF